MIDAIMGFVKSYPLLTTGVLATSGGMFWGYLRAIPTKISNRLWQSFSSTVEIKDNHYEFYEIRMWTNSLKPIFVPRAYQLPRAYTPVPGPGTYWYREHGKFFGISVIEEKDDKGLVRNVKLILRVIGRKVDANKFLVQQIYEWVRAQQQEANQLKIGVQSGQGCNMYFREKRKPTTLFHRVYPALRADIQKFAASKEWYDDRGIPYHRGFLLSGPPGTGKTSIIKTIAGELDLNLYVVTSLATLPNFLNNRDNALKIIVFEDIDRDFKENAGEKVKADSMAKEGFEVSGFKVSEFLNAIDGMVSSIGSIFIFTANDPSALPDAMMRPGRIDRTFEVDYLNTEEIRAYLDLFVDGDKTELEAKLAPLAGTLTGAQVQMHIMQHLEKTWPTINTSGTGLVKPPSLLTSGVLSAELGDEPTPTVDAPVFTYQDGTPKPSLQRISA